MVNSPSFFKRGCVPATPFTTTLTNAHVKTKHHCPLPVHGSQQLAEMFNQYLPITFINRHIKLLNNGFAFHSSEILVRAKTKNIKSAT